MPILIACISGLGLLAALVFSGAMALADLSHPFWQTKASVTGGLIGCILAAGLSWITGMRRRMARRSATVFALVLIAALLVTWRAARRFIDSADYEPLAGQVWFYGYHLLCAMIVATVALQIISLRRI